MSFTEEIEIDELGNWIDEGTIIYKGKEYNFESYYYDGEEYVMINYGKEYELEDGSAQNEIIEVGRIDGIAVKYKELGKNIYEIESIYE